MDWKFRSSWFVWSDSPSHRFFRPSETIWKLLLGLWTVARPPIPEWAENPIMLPETGLSMLTRTEITYTSSEEALVTLTEDCANAAWQDAIHHQQMALRDWNAVIDTLLKNGLDYAEEGGCSEYLDTDWTPV